MRAVDIIMKKRGGAELAREEIAFVVKGYVDGSIPEYQVSAWLMAVFFRGMSPRETADLTELMLRSGKTMDLSGIAGPFVDKHSTGGVGDKVSLILAPLVAACGVKVPMMSGRALGHTGGTLDKLESIPGYRTGLSEADFRAFIEADGFAMTGQTAEIVPADKKLYALRDVTATVESIPLITASILSKKVAEGSEALVFDVKSGPGAFMKTVADAEALARSLGAAPGDIVSVVTAREGGGEGGALFSPKVTPFRVRGVLSSGYRELDSLWAILPLRSGARIMSPATSRSFVGVKAEKPFGPLENERRAVKEALLDGRGGEAWGVSTWAEAERNLWKSFATTRALLLLVMALAVAVAAVNVGSALVMLVLERRRDLAILKSAGASPGQLGLIFILAGLATGGAGSLLGIGLGSLLAWRVNDLISGFEGLANLAARAFAALQGRPFSGELRLLDPAYYVERVPVRLDPGELLLVLLSSLLLCLLASILPARRAARLPPLEIFRKT